VLCHKQCCAPPRHNACAASCSQQRQPLTRNIESKKKRAEGHRTASEVELTAAAQIGCVANNAVLDELQMRSTFLLMADDDQRNACKLHPVHCNHLPHTTANAGVTGVQTHGG
jgi:hypothetical protein